MKSEYKLVQVDLRRILYVEGLKDYIKIYEEENPKPILSLMSMKAMEDKIRIIDRGRIVFGKAYIPVSDSYKAAFQAYLDRRSWTPPEAHQGQ